MKYVMLSGEKDVAELAASVFRFSGRKSKSKVQAAERALLELNPHLARIRIAAARYADFDPEVAEAAPSERTVTTGGKGSVRTDSGRSIDAGLRNLSGALKGLDAKERATAEAFDSPELRKLADDDGSLAARLKRIKEVAHVREAEERTRLEREKEALEKVKKRAAVLFPKLGG